MESALWGLLGTIVGAAASIATTVIATRNAANLQLSAARLERLEKHRAFQREALIELQDAIHDQLRVTSLVYQADESAFHKTGNWGAQLLGDDLNQQAHVASRRTLLLMERIANDPLREHIRSLRSVASEILMARDKATADIFFLKMASEGNTAMEHIGKVLRSLYVEDGPM